MKGKKAIAGVIYAVLFNNGYMKAGVARRDAAGRIKSHESKAAIVGAKKVSELQVNVPFGHYACESELLRVCGLRFTPLPVLGREWFQDVSPQNFDAIESEMHRIANQSAGLAHTCITESEYRASQAFDSLVPATRSLEPDNKFIEALGIAKTLQAMVSNDLISGPIFSRSATLHDQSYFAVTMALHLYAMSDEERAVCVRDVVEGLSDPDLAGLFAVLTEAESTARIAVSKLDAADSDAHHN